MKLILIGAKSKQSEISGQTIAFDLLVNSFSKEEVSIIDINCYSEKPITKILSYLKFYVNLIATYIISKVDSVYLTISQSKQGFLRDFGFIWISFLFRKKIILHLHGGNYDQFYKSQSHAFKFIIKSTLKRADIIIVLSASFREMFSFVDGYQSKVRVVNNGIKVPSMATKAEKGSLDYIKILFLSNLIESKGYLDVLHAAKLLKERNNKSFQLLFCGKFLPSSDDSIFSDILEAEDNFNQFIIQNDLSQNVKYLGVVQGKVKDDALNEAHFIVLPSYYISEGQPISLIEGLAFGCVPISTDYRDLANIVKHKWNGFIVKKKCPEDIANTISSVTDGDFLKLSNNARQHFLSNYTSETHITAMKNIFNEHV